MMTQQRQRAPQQQRRGQNAGGSGTRPLAPPGLEPHRQDDKMMPVKVAIGDTTPPGLSQMLPQAPQPPFKDGSAFAQGPCTPASGAGEWVNAVLATAPYLDAQGLQQALQILDAAIGNVQQAKVLEGILANANAQQQVLPSSPAMPHVFAVEFMRMQVSEQQQNLIRRLHELKASAAANGANTAAGNWVYNAGLARSAAAGVVPGGLEGRGLAGASYDANANSLGACREALAANLARYMSDQCHQPRGNDIANITPEAKFTNAHSTTAVPRNEADAHDGGEKTTNKAMSRQARPQAARYNGDGKVQTLSTSLQLLSGEEPDCLFIVRRINKLGFKAARKLKQHFSTYGTVVRVLVAHSTVRQHGDPQSHARRRPSSLGFVHMATADAVRQVLEHGLEQEVDGSLIRVQRFERQHVSMEGFDEAEDGDVYNMEVTKWSRQQSAVSAISTTASDGKWPSPTSSTSNHLAEDFE